MSIIVDVQNINKYFGNKHVVQNVSIKIDAGKITGFLGPNGSGKTTTLRMLCGLLTPSSGSGKVLNYDLLTQSYHIKKKIGYMTQRFSLYEDMTIEENLMFMGRVHELKNVQAKVNYALKKLNLVDRRKQLAGALSGGWKQRLALSVATLHEPKLLLLDEPTAGVDPQARREFWREIQDLATQGLSVLVSTHYMDEIERCNDIGYILNGSLIARGTQGEIRKQSGLVTLMAEADNPAEVAKIISTSVNILQVSVFGSVLRASAKDKTLLEQSLENLTPNLKWTQTTVNMEEVFIELMQNTTDNRYKNSLRGDDE